MNISLSNFATISVLRFSTIILVPILLLLMPVSTLSNSNSHSDLLIHSSTSTFKSKYSVGVVEITSNFFPNLKSARFIPIPKIPVKYPSESSLRLDDLPNLKAYFCAVSISIPPQLSSIINLSLDMFILINNPLYSLSFLIFFAPSIELSINSTIAGFTSISRVNI